MKLGNVVILATIAVVAGVLILPQINQADDVPLEDEHLSNHLSAQNEVYRNSLDVFELSSPLSEDQIVSNGYSTDPPEGYLYNYVSHKSLDANTDILSLGKMDSVWYPGALVKLTSASGSTVPVSFVAPRSPYTLSLGLEGSGIRGLSTTVDVASPSSAREAVATMVDVALGSDRMIPTTFTCDVIEASSSGSVYAGLGTTADLFGFNLGLKGDFRTSSEKTVAMLVFKQVYYEVTMDPPSTPSAIFSSFADASKIIQDVSGSDSLAYVDVTYGKVVIVEMQTTKTFEEINASFNAGYTNIVDLEASFKEAASGSNTKLSYFVYGGSNESMGILKATTIPEVVSVIAEDDSFTSRPIQYSFKFLDGMPAEYYTYNDYVTREVVKDTTDHFKDSFEGGDGTIHAPYLIATTKQLNLVRNRLDVCYRLVSDIDISFCSWTPIGDYGDGAYGRFSGIFDGNGYTISGMTVDSTAHMDSKGSHAGLFAMIDGGSVKNLRLVNVDMSPVKTGGGVLKVGAVVGTIIGGSISGVYVEGKISCSEGANSDVMAGGIIGSVDKFDNPHKVTVGECVVDMDINVYGNNAYGGGIIGRVNGSNTVVKYCFNYGEISTNAYGGAFDYKHAISGGIVGKCESSCSIDHSFNSGKMKSNMAWGWRDSAGLIGNVNCNNVCISDSYYLAGTNYEGGKKQGDVFCDGGAGNIAVSRVSVCTQEDIAASLFETWKLDSYGMVFNGFAVVLA